MFMVFFKNSKFTDTETKMLCHESNELAMPFTHFVELRRSVSHTKCTERLRVHVDLRAEGS